MAIHPLFARLIMTHDHTLPSPLSRKRIQDPKRPDDYTRWMGDTEGYKRSAMLPKGLAALGPDFNAEVCAGCQGHGSTRQMYTAGCGGDDYYAPGICCWCAGAGLTQGGDPAPESVVQQVLNAADKD